MIMMIMMMMAVVVMVMVEEKAMKYFLLLELRDIEITTEIAFTSSCDFLHCSKLCADVSYNATTRRLYLLCIYILVADI